METRAHAVRTTVRPKQVAAARARTAEPRGSLAVAAFYLVAAVASLTVVAAAAVGAAL